MEIVGYSKIEPFLAEIREIFREPDFLLNLEKLVLRIPDIEAKMEGRRRLIALWNPQEKGVSG